MSALIDLKNISVFGVDTHARAATLRRWFVRRQSFKSPQIPILRDVTLNAQPGDRIGIFGKNGSGKSSLLKVISGNYPIHEGSYDVRGTIVPIIEMGAGFEGEMSGRKNIEITYAYRGKLRSYSPEIEEKIIEFSELGDKIDLPLKSYSSGMRARLAFSSAIFQDPDILLLDEVLATGDGGFVEKSLSAIKSKIDRAAITVFVSHNHKEMTDICNRFLLMHQGRIINEGSAQDMLKQYESDILHINPAFGASHAIA